MRRCCIGVVLLSFEIVFVVETEAVVKERFHGAMGAAVIAAAAAAAR